MDPYTHYLMWMKSRNDMVMSSLNKRNNNSSPSWEEAAVHGGFAWPPRFYLCNFCKREFRSAQALGGHMNVHRRDRAKLKQSLIISPSTTSQDLHHQDLNHTSPVTTSYDMPPANSFHFFQPKLHAPCGTKNQDFDFLVDKKLCLGIGLDEDMKRCKRRKKTVVSLWKKPCFIIDSYGLQSDRLGSGNKINPMMEDIDLELRLGDPPAV